MFSKIGYIIRIICIKIKNGKSVKIPLHSRIGSKTQVFTYRGKIVMGRSVTTLDNTHLSAIQGGRLSIGDSVFFNRNCTIVSRKGISIGNHCAFGPNVCIYDHDHLYSCDGMKSGYKTSEVVIENNCWVGAGCIILRGSHIGEASVIGAGCVIKGDVPPASLVTMDRTYKIKAIREI